MERTLVIIKPNAVQREIVGEIISRFERRGFKIVAVKMILIARKIAEKHYREHLGKDFYESVIRIISSGPSVVMILEGEKAVKMVRTMCGATDPGQALPGTVRGDYGMRIGQNIIHASDSAEASGREIRIFFKDDEIVEYRLASEPWV